MKSLATKLLAVLLCLGTSFALSAQTTKITGVVTDENGEPLMGAGVFVEGTTVGTVTGLDGDYELVVPADAANLVYSFIGLADQTVAIAGRTRIDVQLTADTTFLDEVVVIGYATVKRRDLMGSVSSVDSKSLTSVPVASVSEALTGKMAGVQVTTTEGDPDADIKIRVRGSGSITQDSSPLYIVDGFPVESINDIPSSDIQSIDILKDAFSTAIYGSRGANGVILISTIPKEQKQVGSFTLSFNTKAGVHLPTGGLDLMDASEYGAFRNAAWSTSKNWDPSESNHYYADPSALGRGTDWVDLLTRPAIYQDYYLSLNGKASNVNYFMSLSCHDEDGIMIGAGHNRITGKTSFDARIKPWMKVGAKLMINYQKTDKTSAAVGGTSTSAAIYLSPILGMDDTWNYFGDDES